MATYGTRDANRWKPASTVGPNAGGDLGDTQFYPVVNSTTGQIEIKRLATAGSGGSGGILDVLELNSGALDQTVATKDPGQNWVITDKATTAEKSWLGESNNQKTMLNQAKITSIKAQQNLGVTPEASRTRTEELFKTGTAVTPTGTAPVSSSTSFQQALGQTKEGTRNGVNAFGGNMRYPLNMSSSQDKIKIDMVKFSPRQFQSLGSGFGERASTEDIIGSVMLAIPGGIRDDNRVSWGSQDMNAVQAKIASAASKFILDGQNVAKDNATMDKLRKEADSPLAKAAVGLHFAGAAVGAQGLLARTTGAVLNPNTELLFSGPALRAFTFTFPFSPRSKGESEQVQRIIRFFKQGMAVQRTENSLFLKAPNVFKLKFVQGESAQHKFLPKIKLCALLNCSVDYTPDGNYSTYINGSMTNYTMTLTFNELDPLYNDEYTGKGESTTTNNIGF